MIVPSGGVVPKGSPCGGERRPLGSIPVRSRGTGGGRNFLPGGLARLGERVLPRDEDHDSEASVP
ncbi:MAG: hypothetical protein ACREIU_15390 [Planctomycetota bacterium]